MRFSEQQINVLLRALNGKRVVFCGEKDACMNALKRKGMASFNSRVGERYGKVCWYVNDAGMTAARAIHMKLFGTFEPEK